MSVRLLDATGVAEHMTGESPSARRAGTHAS